MKHQKPPADEKHIKDLKFDPTNARKHNPRNIGLIADALHEVGAARSIVIDEDDIIRAGNGTIEAAAQVGITKVKVVDADGETIIAVRRRGLTEEQKQKLALYDNRAAELAEWDVDALRQLHKANPDALAGLFDPDELAKLLDEGTTEKVDQMTVERPTDVAWVLLAIPVADWPKHQAAVEAMQLDAKFTTMVMRPADGSAGTFSQAEKRPL